MRIAVDAMGSDNAPLPEVEGAIEAASSSPIEVILVGDETRLKPALEARAHAGRISTVHASQVIGMHDAPALAVRQKKDASLLVALRLVKEGQADGVISAGNTGAVMVAARAILGPLRGVSRSPICTRLPTAKKPVLLLDIGTNADCTARHLCEFAEMGMIYASRVLGVANPRVGLLNIGEEQLKGNELAKTVHRELSAAEKINFVGNVEPKALFAGAADVVVCDGFVGNVFLKTSEAAAGLMITLVKRELLSSWPSRVGALLSSGAFRRLLRTYDPNEYTGAVLLGVNGVVIIIHGACEMKGVANGIRGACRAVETALNEHIRLGIEELRNTEATLRDEESAV